mmetsp:Transcript_13018/g.23936  ORF Transcript_13018/g.23936 Transcript_13018/m.23936 type:complete len:393 (-) Transcript_13018:76-1254(-)
MVPPPPDVTSTDYYKVLGVERTATDAEVAKAYKRLALKYHPDKNPDNKESAEESFKKITEAYTVLHDAEQRKAYDENRQLRRGSQSSRSAPGGMSHDMPFGTGFASPGMGMSRERADRVFQAFFGGVDPFAAFFTGEEDDGLQPGFQTHFGRAFTTPHGATGPETFVFCTPGGGSVFTNIHIGSGSGTPGMNARKRCQSTATHRVRSRPDRRAKSTTSRRGSTSSAYQSPSYAIPSGTTVSLHGLTKAPDFNGKVCTVVQWDDVQGRYEVQVEGDDRRLNVRPLNLTQTATVEVVGLQWKPELNGRRGEVRKFLPEKERYLVVLKNPGTAIGLQPANCILQRDTRVVLTGLTSVQYNGQLGTILDIDRDKGRYLVQCSDGKQIHVKYENVRC